MILSQQLNLAAVKSATRPALSYLGKEMNYTELRTRVARLSYLFQHDIGHGARVAFLTRNSPAVVASFFALSNTRSITILLDPDKPPSETLDALRESKATHIAVTSDLTSKVRDMLVENRLSLPIIEIEKKQGGEYDTSYTPTPDNVPNDADPILMFRTPGTTGKPKFAIFNHKQVYHAALCVRGPYHLLPTDRVMTTMNWAHPFAFVHGALMPLMAGGTAVIEHGAEGKDFLEWVVKSHVTRIADSPAALLKILLTCKNEKQGLPGVKSVTVGVGFLNQELRKVFTALKIAVAQTYGQAEACWTIAMEDTAPEGKQDTQTRDRRSVGKGLAGIKYKVLDEKGDEIPGRETRQGMLAIMGPNTMVGYYEREQENRQALRGTWLYTGDYFRLEGEGETLSMTFLGRREELIVRQGEIISPEAIDGVVRAIPGVQDSAGFPVKTSRDELVLACAVVKVQGSGLNEKQIMDHCHSKMNSDRAPHAVMFVDVIPRDPGGNVKRAKLRSQFSGSVG
jgi:long-chain acyl-CoA synthetase